MILSTCVLTTKLQHIVIINVIVSSDIERLQTLEDKERQLLLELMWALARETEHSAKKAEDEVLKETQRLQNIERKVRNSTLFVYNL